jgi:hypothetical protein
MGKEAMLCGGRECICCFGHNPFSKWLIYCVLLMIQNLFFIMSGIIPEMTGNQRYYCCTSNKIEWKCKQKNWIPTIVFAVVSLQSHGIVSVARLQRQEGSWANKKLEELVAFVQESKLALHPLSNFRVSFDVASTQIHSQIYWKLCLFANTWQI